jgi:hypothetical protein
MSFDPNTIPEEAKGLRLCKIVKEELVVCETVIFERGYPAVQTILNRAQVSGEVGPVGETGDYWADLMSDEQTWFDTVKLDRKAWNSLKNHWMRCRIAK